MQENRYFRLRRPKGQRTVNYSDEWYTPPHIIESLGPFDLDPACGELCTNPTASRRYLDGGLDKPWSGRIWLNPPFSDVVPWVNKMIDHNNGVMLVFSRTEAAWFQRAVSAAGSVFMFRGRIQFRRPGGITANRCPMGCVLIPFGDRNRRAIERASSRGVIDGMLWSSS